MIKKTQLIFGSTAMKHWFPEFREPSDLDLIKKGGLSTKLEQHYWIDSFDYILENNIDLEYVDPHFLLAIKASHFGWDIHWSKTMNDILFLKERGYSVDPALYKMLVKDWTVVHGKKWGSLEKADSTTFFEDAVPRKYVHDSIHEAVAVGSEPLYFKILKDDSGVVGCSKEKFDSLTEKEKENLVREEVWVTALERYLVPADFKCSTSLSYFKSLKKLATTMSSGWFKQWIISNFDLLYVNNNVDWVNQFKSKLIKGEIEYEE
jgi:hypothetical protein